MNDHSWHQTVHSDTLPPFLVPEEPALGDELGVRLRVARDAPVAKVYVRAIIDWDVYEGAIMLLAFLPGTFSIYYGDEIGIPGTLDGDHGKRYPMRWSPNEWDERFVDLYRRVARLKREREALHRGSFRVLDAGDDYLVAARFTTGEALVSGPTDES